MPAQPPVDDETLRNYLFRSLPEEQAEQLDELSVTDDAIALRLDTIETDLIDAYVNGQLTGSTLRAFQVAYLSTPGGRGRVGFARSLSSFGEGQAPATRSLVKDFGGLFGRGWFKLPRLAYAGGLALLLLISLQFSIHIHHKKTAELARLQSGQTGLPSTLEAAPAVEAPPAVAGRSTGQEVASAIPVSVAAFVLAPQMRGGTRMRILSVPAGTTRVDLSLDLESGEYGSYRAAVKSLGNGKTVWQGGPTKSVMKAGHPALCIRVPANVLRPDIYQADLTSAAASGRGDVVSSYVFEILTK